MLHKAAWQDRNTFVRWKPRRLGEVLRRYGVQAAKSNGKRTYRNVTLKQLRRIERNYGIDLNTDGKDKTNVVEWRSY